MNRPIDHEKELILQKVSVGIMELFTDNSITISEASGVLGSIMGILAARTEKNFPFISLLNSFTRTYHVNYNSEEEHFISGILEPFKKD